MSRELFGAKASKTLHYQFKLYKIDAPEGEDPKSTYLTMEISDRVDSVFYHLGDSMWMDLKADLADWDGVSDTIFFTACRRQYFFIYDIEHKQFVSGQLRQDEDVDWDDAQHCWQLKQFQYKLTSGSVTRNFYSNIGTLGLTDPMLTKEDRRVVFTSDKTMGVVLEKTGIARWDRPVWKVGVFDCRTRQMLIDNLGVYAINDSVKAVVYRSDVGLHNRLNFYGRMPSSTDFVCLTLDLTELLQGKAEALIWEMPGATIERFEFIDEDCCWRPIINGKVIRPARFYFDNLYREPLKINPQPLSVEILHLAFPDDEQVQREWKAEQQRKRDEMLHAYEQQNTSADDIFERGSKHKAASRKMPKDTSKRTSHRTSHKNLWILIGASLLALGAIVGAVVAVASGLRVGPVAMRSIYTGVAGVIMAWVAAITNYRNNPNGMPIDNKDKKDDKPVDKKKEAWAWVIIALLLIIIIIANIYL